MANKNSKDCNASSRFLRACQACAQRRARCDKQRPCYRCKQKNIECNQQESVRLTKSQLRQEKELLQARHEAVSVIFQALASGKQSDEVLELLRRKKPVQQIASHLAANLGNNIGGSSHGSNSTVQQDDYTAPAPPSSSHGQRIFSENPEVSILGSHFELCSEDGPLYHWDHEPDVVTAELRTELQQMLETPFDLVYSPFVSEHQDDVSTAEPSISWLDCHSVLVWPKMEQIPDDCPAKDAFAFDGVPPYLDPCGSGPIRLITLPDNLVLDLTDAFFTWHAAPFPAIQRSHFTREFLSQQTQHSSPALLRIMSCLGCRALGGYDTRHSTYASLGNRLSEESRKLLSGAPACVADGHACGLLALHQLGIGQYGDALQLAESGVKQMATTMGLEGSIGAETLEPLEYGTALGSAVALTRFVRLMVGYLTEHDTYAALSLVLDPSRESVNDLDSLLSLRGSLPTGPSYRNVPSNPLLTHSLIDIVYRPLTTIQDPELDTEHRANYISDTYRKCLLWKDAALGCGNRQSEISPFTHMLYYFCLLALGRPFYQPPPVSVSTNTTVCVEPAAAILSLAGSSSVRDHQAPNQFFLAHLFVLAASFSGVSVGGYRE